MVQSVIQVYHTIFVSLFIILDFLGLAVRRDIVTVMGDNYPKMFRDQGNNGKLKVEYFRPETCLLQI